jgi:hypothetical protein
MRDRFIPGRDTRGLPHVTCRCDECEAEVIIRCAHLTKDRERTKFAVDEGQAIIKLRSNGWSFVKNTLRCPKCEENRKEKNVSKEPTVVTLTPPVVPPLRQPTREQKRLIVAALDDAYDMTNLRYKGLETDKGIAEMLGDGTMPGWVAAVREDMFGPDGNEEMSDLAGEVKDWMNKVDIELATIKAALVAIEQSRGEVKKYQDRLFKIAAAIGPKAERI